MRNTYNTKQKDEIQRIIKNFNKPFTIKDIHSLLKDVGLTTIYRVVDKMYSDGDLNKTIEGSNTFYQYLEKCENINHFYLKCSNCGSLIHIDCECIEKLNNHILKEHDFLPNKDKIIINGICSNCKNI